LYASNGLIVPPIIIDSTKKYESNNNIMKQFIDENIEVGDSKSKIYKTELVNIFNKDSILKEHFENFQNFSEYLQNGLYTEFKRGKNKKPYIQGFYIREYTDDDEEDVINSTINT
jgi:hypothetical protein